MISHLEQYWITKRGKVEVFLLSFFITILGLAVPPEGEEAAYSERLNALVEAVGSVLLIHNSEQYDLLQED